MAVTKLDPGLIDSAEIHWDDIPAAATVWLTLPGGRVVQVTMGRLQQLFNAGAPGGDTITIVDGGEMEDAVYEVIDGGELADTAVVVDGGEVVA